MRLYERVLAKIHKWLSELGFVKAYKNLVLWLRQHWLGRAVHRVVRIGVIAAVLVFLANLDPTSLSSWEQAFYAGLTAGLDKALNEFKEYWRNLSED